MFSLTPSSSGGRWLSVTECVPGVASGAEGKAWGAVFLAVLAGLDCSENGPADSP